MKSKVFSGNDQSFVQSSSSKRTFGGTHEGIAGVMSVPVEKVSNIIEGSTLDICQQDPRESSRTVLAFDLTYDFSLGMLVRKIDRPNARASPDIQYLCIGLDGRQCKLFVE